MSSFFFYQRMIFACQQVLFLNRHKTHLTGESRELCNFLQIKQIIRTTNVIHIFQPCDVVFFFFTPLKAQWNKNLLCGCKNNLHEALTKVHMVPILKIAMENDITVAINNSSKVTGLYPFSTDAVDILKVQRSHQ